MPGMELDRGGAKHSNAAAAAAARAAYAAVAETEDPDFTVAVAAMEEEEVEADVALQDLRLQRLQLSSVLQRYREQAPIVDDVARRHEGQLAELEAEVRRLQEENSILAFGSAEEVGEGGCLQMGAGRAASSSSLRTEASQPRPRARTAVEELSDEVFRLQRRQWEQKRSQRRHKLEEWGLGRCRSEAVHVVRQVRMHERRLEEVRQSKASAELHLSDLHCRIAEGLQELEQEKHCIRELNREVTSLREACYLPTRLKRESGFLLKVLDQGGTGKLKTRKHLRGMDAVARLYDEVAAHAPSLLQLAGRVRGDMTGQFARYQHLDKGHTRSLHRLHTAVARSVCCRQDKLGGIDAASERSGVGNAFRLAVA